jgi:peptidylprolyl isomerase
LVAAFFITSTWTPFEEHMKRILILAAALSTALTAEIADPPATAKPASQAAKKPATKGTPAMTTTASGLKYIDTVPGSGESPQRGKQCVMHYTGWLWVNEAKGAKFDSSVDRGQPFSFTLGVGQVIKGWDEGVSTMKKGGKRTLIIPPELGYGSRAMGNVIPANSTLVFEVELIDFK